jgi:hypothetical protein
MMQTVLLSTPIRRRLISSASMRNSLLTTTSVGNLLTGSRERVGEFAAYTHRFIVCVSSFILSLALLLKLVR